MASIEEQKRELLPFLQRADEVEGADPKVAYYCRLYAVDLALRLPQRAKPLEELLVALVGGLEHKKQTLQLDRSSDQQHCEAFALRIFGAADRADRAGRADKGTANKFYVSSFFFEILNQFGPLPPSDAEKQRYAAWKAADIRKALREGRQPAAGPPAAALPDVSMEELEQELAAGGQPEAPGPQDPAGAPPSLPSGSPALPGGPASTDPAAARPGPGTAPGAPAGPPPDAPRFSRGQHILAWQEGSPQPVKGIVAGLADTPGHPRAYQVGLAQSTATLPEAELAPDLEEGARVDVVLRAGPTVRGRCTRVHAQQWPVLYDFLGDDGQERTVEARQVVVLATPAAAPGAPDMGLARPGPGPSLLAPAATSPTPKQAPAAPGPGGARPPPASPPGGATAGSAAAPGPIVFKPAPPPAAHPQPPSPSAGGAAGGAQPRPSLQAVVEAQKLAKYAQSALGFDDIPTAVKNLQEALRLLTQP